MAKHLGPAHPDETFNGQWHVGRSHAGMFPSHELSCPCPVAPCGLAAPEHTIDCPEHMGAHTLLQIHHDSDCRPPRRGWPRPEKTR